MNVKCRICSEFFCPSDDCLDLIMEGIILSKSVNICEDCLDRVQLSEYDLSESYSDADPGL
jgi:hypothetical protein